MPNEALGKIWTLADTEQKGALGLTEFIIAMHLLASMKNGSMRALPQVLPAGLYEAAARRGVPRQMAGPRPTSDGIASAIPRQYSGQEYSGLPRTGAALQQAAPAGEQWLITSSDKQQFDRVFASVDTQNRGFITGEQAVGFFSNSRLPEEALAQIWDLADINSAGQLNRDEFAVAMYLIRQQRSKATERDILPQQLPPNLIPPSMRRQHIAPQQPTAPAFDNAANITVPKSASEDLFGLDAFSSLPSNAPPQPKSTGDSSIYTTPTRSQVSPPPSSQPSSQFKQFVPSSSFGQTIMTPQGTGTSSSTSPVISRGFAGPQKQPLATEDLLGDNDPEISKKLTSETSDLANLSNQVSTLTGQMQDISTKRGSTERDLNHAQMQKKEFEMRLSQLRTTYEQEVREVRALEERLTASRNETKQLQSDLAMIQATHEDLTFQHRQVGEALGADQSENNNLKERIRQASIEIEQLKPQLEKLRSDARHQKGLVAINKKQLATHEAEREKVQGGIDGASAEHAEATKELDLSQRDIETASQARSLPPAASNALPAVASPAPSTASMNPFFRRSSNAATSERGTVASPFTPLNIASPNHNAFDNLFGPSGSPTTGPPPTSFRNESPSVPRETLPVQASSNRSSDDTGMATPPASAPASNFSDSPATAFEPPAPPQSRQITSSFLPLRPTLDNTGSESSSVKVVPPGSRMGESSENPVHTLSESYIPESPKQHFQDMASKAPQSGDSQSIQSSSEQAPPVTAQVATLHDSVMQTSGMPSASRDVPGAFPGDETPVEKPQASMFVSPYSNSSLDPRVDSTPRSEVAPPNQASSLQHAVSEPFGKTNTPTSMSAKDDFDSAFDGFPISKDNTADLEDPFDPTRKGKAPEQRNGVVTGDSVAASAPAPSRGEFPPIREFGVDDESDSDSDHGFDDDFTKRSANRTQETRLDPSTTGKEPGGLVPLRPQFETASSSLSQLPTPGAQTSPPTYDQTVGAPTDSLGHRKESNQFPAEYSGLLPSRDDPTSPPGLSPHSTIDQKSNLASSAGIDRGLNFFGESPEQAAGHANPMSSFSQDHSPMSPGASTGAPYAYSQTSPPRQSSQPIPPVPAKGEAKDEFDFDDLAPAQEETGKGEDDLDFSRRNTDFDGTFNPTFDSPQTSHMQGQSQSSNYPASDSFADFEASASTTGNKTSAPQQQPISHDWDAIFAGLDTPQNNGAQPALPPRDAGFVPAKSGAPNGLAAGEKAITAPMEASPDDDPILKRLIGMGFARGASLQALEKYDYNIDKVCNPPSPSVTPDHPY